MHEDAIKFRFEGFELTAADFGAGLRDRVAVSIAFAATTHYRSKEEALERIYFEADRLLAKITGAAMPPEDEDQYPIV